jgi:hypothetical protein
MKVMKWLSIPVIFITVFLACYAAITLHEYQKNYVSPEAKQAAKDKARSERIRDIQDSVEAENYRLLEEKYKLDFD